MTKVNHPDSQNDVITTMTHAMLSFQEMVSTEMPDIPVIYVQDLSYENALKQIIANDNKDGSPTPCSDPLFAYNRSVLREVEDRGLGRRAKNCTKILRVGNEVLQYSAAYGEVDINFLYASKNIELAEKFEVVYNSEEGISGTKEIIVDMEDLGEFKYFLEYKDLVQIDIEHDDLYFKGIVGSILMRGFYFTFRGKSGVIETINSRILSASASLEDKESVEILSDCPITET